jgi:hypothetical protein
LDAAWVPSGTIRVSGNTIGLSEVTIITWIAENDGTDHAMFLRVLYFQASKGTTIPGNSNLAFQLNSQSFKSVKVYSLASTDVYVFCRCVASKRIAMEYGDSIRIAEDR